MTTIHLRDEVGSRVSSLRSVGTGLGCTFPMSLRDLVARNARPVKFSQTITTREALGGKHFLEIHRDGSYYYSGYLRATGWPSFSVSVVSALGITISTAGGDSSLQLGFNAQGEAHGTDEVGERQFEWHQHGTNQTIADFWPAFKEGTWQAHVEYKSNYLGVIGDIGSWLGAIVAMGTLLGPTGAAIAIAGDAAGLADANELIVPGLIGVAFASGVAFLVSPGLLIPAFLVGAAITPALIKQRKLEPFECAFADQVFGGKIPYDRILLTNMSGFDGHGFTVPGPGDVILVNMGEGYEHPTTWAFNASGDSARAPGHLFMHELTHAWQIAHDSFTPILYCEAVREQAWALYDRPAVYRYGAAGKRWSDYRVEQQASIVADWFAGKFDPRGPVRPQQAFEPMDEMSNPFWPYIRDNIRGGIT
ncbi:hypothetical protein [Dyella japonica]|uniref:Uncharacterized protein n=1 Tax=Dyella japonica TaxID=231455 RepID=A0ABV2JPP2_9GAMM